MMSNIGAGRVSAERRFSSGLIEACRNMQKRRSHIAMPIARARQEPLPPPGVPASAASTARVYRRCCSFQLTRGVQQFLKLPTLDCSAVIDVTVLAAAIKSVPNSEGSGTRLGQAFVGIGKAK